jgi:hypothetical protein
MSGLCRIWRVYRAYLLHSAQFNGSFVTAAVMQLTLGKGIPFASGVPNPKFATLRSTVWSELSIHDTRAAVQPNTSAAG